MARRDGPLEPAAACACDVLLSGTTCTEMGVGTAVAAALKKRGGIEWEGEVSTQHSGGSGERGPPLRAPHM